jgi:hypothetical protein
MSRANLAADFGSTRTVTSATKTLAPALSCARRGQLSIEGLGGAFALPLLTGVVAGAAALPRTGATMGRSSFNLVGDL